MSEVPPRATRLESVLILGTPVALGMLLLVTRGAQSSLQMTTLRILRTVVFEIVFSAVVAIYLWRRGWRWRRALFVIGPLGVCYFLYYQRSNRIWPPILAHGVQDLIALGALALRGTP